MKLKDGGMDSWSSIKLTQTAHHKECQIQLKKQNKDVCINFHLNNTHETNRGRFDNRFSNTPATTIPFLNTNTAGFKSQHCTDRLLQIVMQIQAPLLQHLGAKEHFVCGLDKDIATLQALDVTSLYSQPLQTAGTLQHLWSILVH